MKQAAQCARRAMAIAEEHDDHSAYARATTALSVPQWARYDLHGSLATLEDGVAHAARRGRRVAARGWAGVPGAARAHLAGPVRRGRDTRARVLRHRRAHAVPVGAGTAARRAHADRGRPRRLRPGRAVRAPGAPAAAPLGVPLGRRALPARHRGAHAARGQFEQAREALATWSETADELEQTTVDLFSRWVTACERRLAVLGAPLPGLPANRWSAGTRGRCWRSSSHSGKAPPATCARRATSSPRSNGAAACSSAAPRRWWRATSAWRRTSSARRPTPSPPCSAPSPSPTSCARSPSWRARRPTSPPSTSGGASAATGSRCSTRRSPPSAASASNTTWPARSS